jgi:putative ATP-dependent endonuclease of the OLD family
MVSVSRVKLHNFKRFQNLDLRCHADLNLLIGDNEAGKSSILQAIDICLSASRSKVERLGLDRLMNQTIVQDFLTSEKGFDHLPLLTVEIYTAGTTDPLLFGRNNLERVDAFGLKLVCEKIDEYRPEIEEILVDGNRGIFPYEFYSIQFSAFSGEPITPYLKHVRHLLLDSSQIADEYSTREYIRAMYQTHVEPNVRITNEAAYRMSKSTFRQDVLKPINDKIPEYDFDIRTSINANLEGDLTLKEGPISIENKGKGRQSIIKISFALQKKENAKKLDLLLLEEPENHLSHVNTRKLLAKIADSTEKQIFVATHSSLICSRLDLRKATMLNSSDFSFAFLADLPPETAKFFMKATDSNVLELILSKRAILVEGNAEYILMERFFRESTKMGLEETDVHVISVGGTSFKRYLDVAKLLKIRVAVVRDNDRDPKTNCVQRYVDYRGPTIEIFFDEDPNAYTFEVCLYEINRQLCDDLFGPRLRSVSVQDHMLNNKSDAAFELLESKKAVKIPSYIEKAIEWISQ